MTLTFLDEFSAKTFNPPHADLEAVGARGDCETGTDQQVDDNSHLVLTDQQLCSTFCTTEMICPSVVSLVDTRCLSACSGRITG